MTSGHLVTFSYCLLCFAALRRIESQGTWPRYLVFGLFLVLAAIDDTFALLIIAVPVGLVCAARVVLCRPRRTAATMLAATVASVILAVGFRRLILWLGGAAAPVAPLGVVHDLQQLGANALLLAHQLLSIFGATVLEHPLLEYPTILALVRASGLAVVLLIVGVCLLQFHRQSLSAQVLLVIIATNLIEVLGGSATTWGSDRYLLPTLIFGTILVAGYVAQSAFFKRHSTAVLIYFLFLGLCLLQRPSFSMPSTPEGDLGSFLLDRHLVNGYGPYGTANVVTLLTGGKVTMRPVYSTDGKNLQPVAWLSDRAWYATASHFVVVDPSDPYGMNISIQQAANTFGAPSSELVVGQYTVLVWDTDITSDAGYAYRLGNTGLSVHGAGLWELPREVGHLEHGEIASDGTPGFLAYGPGVPLESGQYELTLYGSAPQASSAWVDVTIQGGAKEIATFSLLERPGAPPHLIAQGRFNLPANVPDLEIRLYVTADDVVQLEGYDVVRLHP